MTFGETMYWLYVRLGTLVFSAEVIYFTIRGVRDFLRERKQQ